MRESFKKFADRQAATAAKEGREPMPATPERVHMWRDRAADATMPVYLFPYLGGYLPPGWRRINLHPVADTKGVHMDENEGHGVYVVSTPDYAAQCGALDPFEFANRIEPGWSYAIVGENAGCVLIGAFVKTGASPD